MGLSRLIYFSENQIDAAQGSIIRSLSAILSTSNRNNKPLGLTGALLFDDQWFIQALEGEPDNVWKTYERIREDERHANVVIVELREVTARTFGNWWMGLATRTTRTEALFAPYVHKGRLDPRRLDAGQMLSLMEALAGFGLSRELIHPKAARPHLDRLPAALC